MASPETVQSFTPDEMAVVLTKLSGRRVTADMIREAIADGAPADAAGRLSIRALCVWINQEMWHGPHGSPDAGEGTDAMA